MSSEKRLIEPTWFRFLKGVACGTNAGIVVTLIGHPFDTLKVRLQVQESNNPLYSGMIDCARKTIKWEGFRGLYKGVASPLAGQLFIRTIMFTGFYETTELLAGHSRKVTELKPYEYYISGAVTGFFSSLADSPADLFKSKLQLQILSQKKGLPPPNNKYFTGVYDCFRQISREYGIRGVYQGYGPTFLRNTIGFCIYFGTFELFKRAMLKPGQNVQDIEFYKIVLAGSICGVIFWIITYNIDVIKSAMMGDDIRHSHRRYSNIIDCGLKLMKNEGGYFRLWNGFLPCFIRAFPANGMMLLTVDVSRRYFPSYNSF